MRRIAVVMCATLVALVLPARSAAPATPQVTHTTSRVSTTPCGTKAAPPPDGPTHGSSLVRASWPERVVEPSQNAQAYDPSSHSLYSLTSETTKPEVGPYRLQRTDTTTGRTNEGPLVTPSHLVLAAGYLWAYGVVGPVTTASTTFAACQINPTTLRVVRPYILPTAHHAPGDVMSLCAGPGGTIWMGFAHSMFRVDAANGDIVQMFSVPAGLVPDDMAVDPSGRYLYVAYGHIAPVPAVGAQEGAALYEYNAASGAPITEVTTGPITDSVAGASLVAVPGGVWASFRTGMMGLSILLRQSDLSLVAPASPLVPIGENPADRVFVWGGDASLAYGGGTLFLTQVASGTTACIDPGTGAVRATENLPVSPRVNDALLAVLAVDGTTHRVYAVDSHGLVAITPPAACWS